jgi:non-homologous end joining protein Ku
VSEIAPEGGGKVIDLMEALRASLEKTETARTSTSQLGARKGPKRVEETTKPARKSSKRQSS